MDNKEYVIFRLADESYGIDIDFVENIEKHTEITRVPYTKSYIEGVINLRGNIIPVLNVRTRFGLDKQDADKDSRIMIINHEELKVGLLVDASSEVLQIGKEAIEPAPKVVGIGKQDGRIIMIVDLGKLLEIDQLDEI
jgi:purine-binding chemotaxis protein CheW